MLHFADIFTSISGRWWQASYLLRRSNTEKSAQPITSKLESYWADLYRYATFVVFMTVVDLAIIPLIAFASINEINQNF